MSLKARTCQLLEYLIEKREAISVQQLAEKFDVSSRTIRYDLDEIEDNIAPYNIKLTKKPRVGVYLEGREEELTEAKRELIGFYNYQRILSPKERLHLILFRLFQANEPIIIKELELTLQISKSTIIKDLDKVEKWLKEHNLNLIRKTNYGLEITGEEINMRHAMTDLLEETADEKELIDFLRLIQNKALNDRRLEPGFFTELDKLISKVDLSKLEDVVSFAEKQLGFRLADGAYAGLLVHLALAVSRLLEGKDIHLPKKRLQILQQSNEYRVAQKVANIMKKIFNLEIPAAEIGFITLHLMGAKLWERLDKDKKESLSENDLDPTLILLTKEMIKVVEDCLKVKLNDDTKLVIGLALHLKPTINRIKYDLPLKNPLLSETKEKYGEVFNAAERAAKILQSKLQKDISQDEIGYITLHFGAALERRNSLGVSRKLKVVLVCSSGMGTTNLLASRLKTEFKEIEIVDVFSAIQIENNEVDLTGIDLIITTIALDIDHSLVLQVNPILSEDDKEKIKLLIEDKKEGSNITEYIVPQENKYQFKLEEIIDVIKGEAIIGDEAGLRKSLQSFFYTKGIKVLDDNIELEAELPTEDQALLELLREENIALVEEVNSWEEGVNIIGNLLVSNKYITDNYTQRTIEIIKERGPYVVISPHISLMHAKPDDGVLIRSLGLLVIRKGVNFGHRYNPVHLIFMLAPEDEKSHLSALAGLLKLVNDENFMDEVLEADSKGDIITKITEILNKDN